MVRHRNDDERNFLRWKNLSERAQDPSFLLRTSAALDFTELLPQAYNTTVAAWAEDLDITRFLYRKNIGGTQVRNIMQVLVFHQINEVARKQPKQLDIQKAG